MKALRKIFVVGLAVMAAVACRPSGIFAVGLAVVAAVACRPSGGKDLKTETLNYEESAAHADLSMKVELPVSGQSAAGDRIRAALVEVMDAQLSHIGTYEEERLFPEYEGDRSQTESLVTYYRDKALEAIGKLGSGRSSSTRCPAGNTSSTS